MEPYNFLEDLSNKEIRDTLRMPIQHNNIKIIPVKIEVNDNKNKEKNSNNKNSNSIKSFELRLPTDLPDLSYDIRQKE